MPRNSRRKKQLQRARESIPHADYHQNSFHGVLNDSPIRAICEQKRCPKKKVFIDLGNVKPRNCGVRFGSATSCCNAPAIHELPHIENKYQSILEFFVYTS